MCCPRFSFCIYSKYYPAKFIYHLKIIKTRIYLTSMYIITALFGCIIVDVLNCVILSHVWVPTASKVNNLQTPCTSKSKRHAWHRYSKRKTTSKGQKSVPDRLNNNLSFLPGDAIQTINRPIRPSRLKDNKLFIFGGMLRPIFPLKLHSVTHIQTVMSHLFLVFKDLSENVCSIFCVLLTWATFAVLSRPHYFAIICCRYKSYIVHNSRNIK